MTRNRKVIAGTSLLVLVAGGIGGIASSLWHVPDYYSAILVSEDEDVETRRTHAKRFVQTTLRLFDEVRHDPQWVEEFNEKQINSWLAEELEQKYAGWLPEEVRQPRIQINEKTLDIVFRYRKGLWKGVVSCRLRPWVTGPNQIAIEVQSIRAGRVPIPLGDVLEVVAREIQRVGWTVQSKQTSAGDVLVVDIGRDDSQAPVLEALELKPHEIRISGSRGTGAESASGNPDGVTAPETANTPHQVVVPASGVK